MVLIKKGAEASLYLEEWHNRKVIMKRRLPKKYRIPELDMMIRSQRTVHEPNIIHKAKEAGVPTPTVFMVDVAEANIIMEFVERNLRPRFLGRKAKLEQSYRQNDWAPPQARNHPRRPHNLKHDSDAIRQSCFR
jgi:Kae1-associated kinase Bud32